MLTKPGDEMGVAPRPSTVVASAVSVGKAAKVEVASVLGEGLGAAKSASPAPVMAKASMPKAMRSLFGKKKKM